MDHLNNQRGRRKVRWIIAHVPLELFIRAAKAFQQEIENLCPGQFDIEIHTIGSYLKTYKDILSEEEFENLGIFPPNIQGLEVSDGSFSDDIKSRSDKVFAKEFKQLGMRWKTLFNLMKNQKIEMSQTQISILGTHLNRNFHAIDLPFLFNNHDHVSKVLDGDIGKEISDRASAETGIKALCYTYSGGYRIIGSTEGITKLDDLKEKTFISFTAPSDLLFNEAEIPHLTRWKTTAKDIENMSENGGAIETTYLRFQGKNILKTNHSMFITSILTSNNFLNTITEEQRNSFIEAARRVAKIERVWSLEDADNYERKARQKGIKIYPVNSEDDKRLREASKEVFKKENLEKIGIDYQFVNKIIDAGK